MNTRLLAFALGLFAITTVRAQVVQPKKGDNLVLIQTPDSAGVALRKLAQSFVAQGYTVGKYDKQFYTLLLAPKTMSTQYNPVLTIRATSSDAAPATVRLSADYKVDYANYHFANRVEYLGAESGNNKTAFREMQKAAISYPGGRVSYTKQ